MSCFLETFRSTREIPPAAADVSASSRSDEDTSIEGSDILETEPWDLMGAFARAEPGLSLGKLVQVHVSVRDTSLVGLFKGNDEMVHIRGTHTHHPEARKINLKKKVWDKE